MTDPLVFVATNDLVSHTRGRAVTAAAEPSVLKSGVGWVPANLALTATGAISEDNIFGSTGDLRLLPDDQARFDLPATDQASGLRMYLADQVTPDGEAWGGCPRTFLRGALDRLREEAGLEVTASFEHEFTMPMPFDTPPFSLERLRAAEPLGSRLMERLAGLGLDPENWLPEYGDNQFEVTLKPAPGLVAADRAVILRDTVRDLARELGTRASFSPLPDPNGSGNGVHVHISLRHIDSGEPALYDENGPARLSELGRKFAAGILNHAEALLAITAPSPISYLRLTPHRWSAGGVFLADRNREAMLRICPVVGLSSSPPSDQLHLEFRAADAVANPWMVLGALLHAGLSGLGDEHGAPAVVHPEDMSDEDVASTPGLPTSLAQALEALENDEDACGWFDPVLLTTYLQVKRAELQQVSNMDERERCEFVGSLY